MIKNSDYLKTITIDFLGKKLIDEYFFKIITCKIDVNYANAHSNINYFNGNLAGIFYCDIPVVFIRKIFELCSYFKFRII